MSTLRSFDECLKIQSNHGRFVTFVMGWSLGCSVVVLVVASAILFFVVSTATATCLDCNHCHLHQHQHQNQGRRPPRKFRPSMSEIDMFWAKRSWRSLKITWRKMLSRGSHPRCWSRYRLWSWQTDINLTLQGPGDPGGSCWGVFRTSHAYLNLFFHQFSVN